LKHYYFIILLFLSCCHTDNEKNNNSIFVKSFTPQQLKQDIDYVRNSLTKKHPHLYWYISRSKLDYQFDSLKKTINAPLTAPQFRHKLLHILSSIGDGHIALQFDNNKLSTEDMLFFSGSKEYPIQQLTYKIIKNRLYVLKNRSGNNTLSPGAEILSIDNKPSFEIIKDFSDEWVSDGYNQTYKIGRLNLDDFPSRYYFTYGLKENLTFTIKQHNDIKSYVLSVRNRPKPKRNDNWVTTSTSTMPLNDRAAYIKVSQFVNVSDPFSTFFARAKKQGLKCLILDLRDNLGGDYMQMVKLFEHLINKPAFFCNIKVRELDSTQKAIAKSMDYGTKVPILPNRNHFDGKVYVIINGPTFSAAALLAANLQVTSHAILVGEETGGGRNGCIAGVYQASFLPNTKLFFRFGLYQFIVRPQVNQKGRGVMPDIPIVYTIKDYLSTRDLEREWIDNDIKAKGVLKQ